MTERSRRLAPAEAVPGLVAVAVWGCFCAAGLLVRATQATHALRVGVQVLPLAAGIVLAVAAAVAVGRRQVTPVLAGVLLGALAGWVSFALFTALAGTPYGIGALTGDCGRTVAAAEQFRYHVSSTDQFIKGNPAQLPPLWPWLWGRAAALAGREAYQVQGVVQAAGLGLVVLATGWAWRLVTAWPRAVAAAGLTSGLLLVSLGYDPCKGYEIGSALITLPVLLFLHLAVLSVLAGGRRWGSAALAGVLLGLCFLLYQLFPAFGALGLVTLWVVLALRGRRLPALLAHLAVTAAAGFVTVSWYLLPFVSRLLSNDFPRAPDPLMVLLTTNSVPGLPLTLGTTLAAVSLLALATLAWRPREPLAQGLIALVAAGVAVQLLGLLNVVRGGESLFSYRSVPWLVAVCGGTVALLAERPLRALVRAVGAGRDPAALRRVAAAALGVFLLVGTHTAWTYWHAPTMGVEALPATFLQKQVTEGHNRTALAYATTLPTCRRVAGLPRTAATTTCFPGTEVQRCIRTAFHDPAARPVLVAYDGRAGMYFGNKLYLGDNAGATGPLDAWLERRKELQRLATVIDPATFLESVRHTAFGPIDGFVLAAQRSGTWRWVAQTYHGKAVIDFTPAQFSDPAWHVCRTGPTVVALQGG